MKRSPVPHHPPALQTVSRPQHAGALLRRVRSPGFLSRKRVAAAARAGGGRRSGPVTPLLRWKFDDADATAGNPKEVEGGRRKKTGRNRRNAGEGVTAASARRLAAGIWQLGMPEMTGQVTRSPAGPCFQPPEASHLCNLKGADPRKDRKDELPGPVSVPMCPRRNGVLLQSMPLTNHTMERATKWDPGLSKASEEVFRFFGHMKFLEDQQETAASVVVTLRTELEQARSRIRELQDECQSSKKAVEHFLDKLTEEKDTWRRREHEKIRAVISSLKDELHREKKNRQRLEVVNSKVINELAEAKLSAKRYMQEYEKERKNRELMEEVCDELAKEVRDDKDEFEALRNESMKIREEVEEERRMLQMAEVWREERVQMKLIDAKLLLEEKYEQLSRLQADLTTFLGNHSGATPRAREIEEAEHLVEAVSSVNIHEKEFNYQSPRGSEDIFSVFEEVQPANEPQEREVDACGYSHASKIHTVSPVRNDFEYNPVIMYADGPIERIGYMEDDSDWETVSHGEENGSSSSRDHSEPSVNGAYLESKGSTSGTEFENTTTGDGKSSSEISEVYSATTKLSRKKDSSVARRWRSSCSKSGENCKMVTVEAEDGNVNKGRPSTGSDGVASPKRRDVGLGLASPNLELASSPDVSNPHITRGMKGWIEWPKGVQKHSPKDKLDKLLEVRKETQKVQLRQVLKQKS